MTAGLVQPFACGQLLEDAAKLRRLAREIDEFNGRHAVGGAAMLLRSRADRIDPENRAPAPPRPIERPRRAELGVRQLRALKALRDSTPDAPMDAQAVRVADGSPIDWHGPLTALVLRGLADLNVSRRSRRRWHITPAGIEALAEAERRRGTMA
jgi:hypothetical protein